VIWFRFPLYLSSKEYDKIHKKFEADEEEWKQRREKDEKASTEATKEREIYLAAYCNSVATFFYETGTLFVCLFVCLIV
jgi:hypothetical protein